MLLKSPVKNNAKIHLVKQILCPCSTNILYILAMTKPSIIKYTNNNDWLHLIPLKTHSESPFFIVFESKSFIYASVTNYIPLKNVRSSLYTQSTF